MNHIQIISMNVGYPKNLDAQGKTVYSGIYKYPVHSHVYLSKLNLSGDAQGDLVHHGGVDKAICVYAFEHYPFWEKELNRPLQMGAFGENLTIQGMLEDEVCIGDTFQFGEAIVQVSQPRQPCYKLALRYDYKPLPLLVQQSGYTGFYFRVLKEGIVAREDGLHRIEPHPMQISVAAANRIMHDEKENRAAVQQLLANAQLSDSWRKTLTKRLHGEETDVRERLDGV